tara:strand:- start:149 stop:421 length:273 start_codon:yes stop_codon:yes gene_type:complete
MLREYDIKQMIKHTCCESCVAKICNFVDNTELTYEEVKELSDRLHDHVKNRSETLYPPVIATLKRRLENLKPAVKTKKEKKNVNKRHKAS